MTPFTDPTPTGRFLRSVNHENRGRENKARAARRCREALSKQLGLITRAQATGLGLDEQRLEIALDDALRRRMTSLPRLRWLVTRAGKGKKGSAILRKMIEEREGTGPIPESVLETRLWKPLTRLGVPPPIKQHPVADGRYRIDFAFPHAMVAVEAQSYTWHSSRRSWERDIDKSNELNALGWTVIYVTWSDLRDDIEATVRRLRDLLLPRFL